MNKWFDDEEVNGLITKLLDRLCTLERMAGGEAFGSLLILIPEDKTYPVLCAHHGKPWYPLESMSNFDVEISVKTSLIKRGK